MSSSSTSDRVDSILLQISALNSSEKSRFFRKFVKRTSRQSSEMNFLRSLVQAVPVGSGLDHLPTEVVSQILGKLDVRTLGRLALTSRKWTAALLNDHRPWKKIYLNQIETGNISQITRFFHEQITESVKNFNENTASNQNRNNMNVDSGTNHKPTQNHHSHTHSPFPYTSALFYESRLYKNWNLANPGTDPIGFECHGTHVVTCMEIDPTGRFILTGSDDGTVKFWNSREGTELRTFGGHLGGVWALRVNWEKKVFVTGSTDRTLILWNLNTGVKLKHFLGHTSTVRCVEIFDDLIVSGSRDGTLRVWSMQSGECLHVLQGHTASVRCLALSTDGRTVVSGSYDFTCRLWDLKSGECLETFLGHTNKVYAVTCSDARIFSGSLDGTVKIWCPKSGECLQTLTGHRSLVGLVQTRPELLKDVVVSGSTDGSLQVISMNPSTDTDFEGTYYNSVFPTAHPTSITSLDFNRNFLVTGSEGVVRLWALDNIPSEINKSKFVKEPRLIANLIETLDMVWRVSVTEHMAVIAYQVNGMTRMAVFNFAPQPQEILYEMREIKSVSNHRKHQHNHHHQQQPQLQQHVHFQPSHSHPQKPQQLPPHQDNNILQAPLFGNVFRVEEPSSNFLHNTSINLNPSQCPSLHPELIALGAASTSLAASIDDTSL